MLCRECSTLITSRDSWASLRKPTVGKGENYAIAYVCSKCRLLHWTNGLRVMNLVEGCVIAEIPLRGPFYLTMKGNITNEPVVKSRKSESGP